VSGAASLGGAFLDQNPDVTQRIAATIINSTITGNGVSNQGGGVWGDKASAITLINDTLDANTASAGNGGDIYVSATCCNPSPPSGTGAITLINTLVGGSAASGGDLATNGTPSAVFLGHNNLIDDTASAGPFTNGVSGNKVGVAAGVGALSNNGGPTQTMPLLTGSAAIGAADASVCAAAVPNGAGGVDQRGVARPASHCSIGAFEAPPAPDPLPAPKPTGGSGGVPAPLPNSRPNGGPGGGPPAPLPQSRP
jgi:hypothetical protein